jgi:3',5'-cyclic AMP phosphodiesterase CpdA
MADDTGGLLQVSDTHFGTEQPAVVDGLVRLVAERQPALVLLSGDITQRATARQFAAARAFCDRLPVPVLAIPGNHDIPLYALHLRALKPYARYAAAFGMPQDMEFAAPGWAGVALVTTRPWRHKHGEVSARQIAFAAERLAQAPAGAVKLVVTHQPAAVTEAHDRRNRLRGAGAALSAWHAAGVDLVLGGHIHLPFVVPWRGAPRPLWVVQAGTAVSSRVREGRPNSVTELQAPRPGAPRACRVRFWDWAGTMFAPRPALDLALTP